MATAPTPTQRPPRPALGRTAGIWILAGATAATAAVALVPVGHLPVPGRGLGVPWWALMVGFYLAECAVVHVHFRRQAHTLSLSEVPLVLGLFAASPLVLVGTQLVGMGAALVVYRRQRPLKIVFNLAQSALGTVLALAVFRSIVAGNDPFGPL